MVSNRKKPPFWQRKSTRRKHDIAVLRPESLPRGRRFETIADARRESERSQKLLGSGVKAEFLSECRAGYYQCNKTYCPICARTFRRWFIGELLRVIESESRTIHISTILLETAGRSHIDVLDAGAYRHLLRKRLERAGLDEASVIGGFEIFYHARSKRWVLHINLMIIGATERAIAKFENSFSANGFNRPTVTAGLRDLPEQLSYLLKFGTYHRPHKQHGPAKSQAVPLNRKEHLALVQWMHQREFKDLLFLFNANRRGSTLVLSDA